MWNCFGPGSKPLSLGLLLCLQCDRPPLLAAIVEAPEAYVSMGSGSGVGGGKMSVWPMEVFRETSGTLPGEVPKRKEPKTGDRQGFRSPGAPS